MNIQSVILICASTLSQPDCTPETATSVIQGPASQSLAQCGFVSQAYIAETSLGDYEDHYVKIRCRVGDSQ